MALVDMLVSFGQAADGLHAEDITARSVIEYNGSCFGATRYERGLGLTGLLAPLVAPGLTKEGALRWHLLPC
jgi:hypothetical protein